MNVGKKKPEKLILRKKIDRLIIPIDAWRCYSNLAKLVIFGSENLIALSQVRSRRKDKIAAGLEKISHCILIGGPDGNCQFMQLRALSAFHSA